MEADHLKVLNLVELDEKVVEQLVGKREGVAAGENHFMNGGVFLNVGNFLDKMLVATFVGKILSKAVAAVHGASTGGDHEDSTVILMKQRVGHPDFTLFTKWVGAELGIFNPFAL